MLPVASLSWYAADDVILPCVLQALQMSCDEVMMRLRWSSCQLYLRANHGTARSPLRLLFG
jgi:hypothetical protein